MRVLSKAQKVAIVRCLVEGNSVRSTSRITGVAINSVQKITRLLGQAALDFQDKAIMNLKNCTKIQCDELWAFCGCKEKALPDSMKNNGATGSLWTWTAMCADSKLMISWVTGTRDIEFAYRLTHDLRNRLACRVQLTTDGLSHYRHAVVAAFRGEVDYAMLIKKYSNSPNPKDSEGRYSPGKCLGTKRIKIRGNPDMSECSTSYSERQNLNIRMGNRRFTRLTNAFSKKAEMHALSFALQALYYNFVRIHTTLKTTPAIAAGIADREWTIEDMVDLLPVVAYSTKKKIAG